MAGTNLAFSKVVATPTPTAWSQAYSAGSLFAAISLSSTQIPQTEENNLSNIGKDFISTLESEFFTLENKDLESIKQAITTTALKIPENLKLSFVVCFLNENILYLYAAGHGKAVLKRGEKIGTVLEGEEGNSIKSASGYVQDKDVIILETEPFIKIVPPSVLASSLDRSTPEEVAEEIAPHVHDKSEGGASAVILTYKEGSSEIIPEVAEAAAALSAAETIKDGNKEVENISTETSNDEIEAETSSPEKIESTPTSDNFNEVEEVEKMDQSPEDISEIVRPTSSMQQKVEDEEIMVPQNVTPSTESNPFNEPNLTFGQETKRRRKIGGGFGKLSRGRKLILIIGTLLVIVIIIAGVLTLTNKKGSSNQAQFNSIYNQANAKIEEGKSLQDLNASLAQESFKQAQTLLQQNVDTFPQGSKEDQQIEALLAQVNGLVTNSSSAGQTSTATEVDKSQSKLLSVQIDNPNAVYFTETDDFIYFTDGKGVNKIDKGNSSKTSIIDKSWKEEGGIGAFGSNIYVLDKTSNIYKFVPSGDDFTKSNYFTGDAPDLSGTAAMTIDGSIYVLDSNGNISKYTKGTKDDFSVSGLEKPFASPTRIQTKEDDTNLYILDKGNSRIVVLDKNGKFVKAYTSDIIKNARDFDVQETNKKIFVLANDKVYQIEIK
jgi:hypothetical protein